MLSHLFHKWEHRLAAASQDRVVRPFNWGGDWLPPTDSQNIPVHLRLEEWVEDAMRNSTTFFDAPATDEYEFTATAALANGEAGTLRFPSALITPDPENNVVSARWFPAHGPERGGPHRAVLVLPQWNADAGGHIGLSRLFARVGIAALRMSLPYHDLRMPGHLTRADYIVSSNIARTIQVCRQAVLDARRAVAWLATQGYDRIGIVGTSLGSCLAMLTSAHEPLIRAQALNHVSPWFADVVWRGLSTRHVRQGLDGNITLDDLRRLWRPISPFSYLERVRHVQTLLVYARYDLTFPVDLSELLVKEFRRRQLPHEVAVLPCGHYSTGVAPFKFLDGYVLTRFLRKHL